VQPDDNHLMERVKDNDSEAFEQLFRKYEHKMLNFFYKLCYSQTLSEDLTQETFMRLWRSRQSFRPDAGKFSTYIFQIGKNCWLSHSGTKKFREEEAMGEFADAPASAASSGPSDLAERHELQEKLHDAIGSLPEDFRMCFVLSRFEKLKYEEIGQVLGISPRTVERKVSDAAKLLAKLLAGKKLK